MNPNRIITALEPIATALWWALVIALALTIAGLAIGWDWLAVVASLAVAATFLPGFVVVLVLLTTRFIADVLTAAEAAENPGNGSARPATGSAAATAENGVIPPK